MICPKCGGEMIGKQKVNDEGLEPKRFECRCGWTVDEATGKGSWPDQKEGA